MQKGGSAYFVDCVGLREASKVRVRRDLLRIVAIVEAHSNLLTTLTSSEKIIGNSNLGSNLREIIEETDNVRECFRLLRGRCCRDYNITHESILPW